MIRRKHTLNAKRDLPGVVGQLVAPLTEQREAHARTFNRYKSTTRCWTREAERLSCRAIRGVCVSVS